jgi:class 3 adenylate cyclase
MEDKPVNLAVLFADISGSTRLYEMLGNALAADCVALLLGIMRGSVLGCGGRVVQTIGDEILCVFPTASAAAQAAVEMQSRVEMQEPVAGQRLQIHVGLEFGAVLEKGQDIFGDCVNVAARMVKLAQPSQIIAGGECVAALGEPMKAQTRALDRLQIKGRQQEVDVYEVLWRQGEDMTYMASQPPASKRARVQLRLRHNGKDVVVGPGREQIRLGRESSSDVVIADRKASREHARIERRRDKFVLIDVSSNGTFVTFHGEPEMAVKREEVLLHGRGSISFGHPYSADPTEVAAFDVEALS